MRLSYQDTVSLLLEGASIGVVSRAGLTPLKAGWSGLHELAVLVLARINRADMDDADENGWTALMHEAAGIGADKCLATLLEHELLLFDQKDLSGRTPLSAPAAARALRRGEQGRDGQRRAPLRRRERRMATAASRAAEAEQKEVHHKLKDVSLSEKFLVATVDAQREEYHSQIKPAFSA